MNVAQPVTADAELLNLARTVLSEQGYALEHITSEVNLLLAENAYFLVGVAATATIADLLTAESIAEALISERVAASDAGPKLWDIYLVLLTQERPAESESRTRDLFDINYDTARLRRIAHVGVTASLDEVRDALAPFVTPEQLDDPLITEDPFKSLANSLASHGVNVELAARAIDAFEKGVPLANVL